MKKLSIVLIFCILLITFTTAPAFAAGPNDNQGKGPPTLDRVIFVNYPRDFAVKGGHGGTGDSTKEWYKYSGYHWAGSNPVIDYKVNLGSYPDIFIVGIDGAFDTWERNTQSNIDFNKNGNFTGIPSSFETIAKSNTINEVGWVNISNLYPNAIAVTMVWYNPGTKEISEVDMAMNSDLPWVQNSISGEPNDKLGAPDYYDVQNIATHEVGHWLMLNDLYTKPAVAQTMYGYGSTGEVKKRSLESGDLAGLRAVYP
jgi:hypothetical protein